MSDNKSSQPLFGPERVLELAKTDAQLQELMPDPAIESTIYRDDKPYWEIIDTALAGYATRPAMGERIYDVVADSASGRMERVFQHAFATVSYGEFRDRIKRLAAVWQNHPQHSVKPGELVCTIGFAGIDYATVDLACEYAHAVGVPLQASLATVNLDGIFEATETVAVAATIDDLVIAAELAARHKSVRSLIACDYDKRVDSDREKFAAAQAALADVGDRVALITLDALIDLGREYTWQPPAPSEEGNQRMVTLMHSSGSTGSPKGVMLTEISIKSLWKPMPTGIPVVRVVFAPMNHFGGRTMLYATLCRGGTAYFTARVDLSELFNDIRISRPTEMVFFPRILEMIHQHYLSEMVRRTSAGEDKEAARLATMEDMREHYLGDRMSIYSVGSAPTTQEIKQFMGECFKIPLSEGYGSTETGVPVAKLDRIMRPPVTDYRLRDVPELGYYTTDQPYPRGELCIKSVHMTTGYFKRPDLTDALFDEDGFLCTGDIMEERGPDHVVYIDRRNDVLKLSQAEFVAVGALGTKFENSSDVIHQIYVYGNSSRSYLLAVVVPNMEIVHTQLGESPSDDALRKLIRSELNKVAIEEGLKAFEVPREFIVEKVPFSRENGLLSNMFKRMRPALKARYGEQLEQIYVDLERRQNEEMMALQSGNSNLTVLEKVGKALEAVLGVDNVDVSKNQTFADLGGDSLDATSFSLMLERIFQVNLPVSSILSPASSPRQWAMAVEAALRNDGIRMATFEQVHGKGATTLKAEQLDLEAFIDPKVLDNAPSELPPAVSKTVLLTGTTGFLGRFMLVDWLERMAEVDGTLICLVRAADQAGAEARLRSVYEGKDPRLLDRFETLAKNHLEVIAGDVADIRFGLDEAGFADLAERVDHIAHPAALVNHILPYQDLFGPNVAGTAELIRLALTSRQKRIDFVSTVGVMGFLEPSATLDENTPLAKEAVINDNYGNGYGASKWAAELLLHRAHERFGIPVNIFRGDMMLAHRKYAGHINAQDIFTRLLYSVVVTGIAPASFHGLNADGSRPKGHYDGLPVDFISGAITGIGATNPNHLRTYHVFNHHVDDGVSLDQIIDWVEDAGYAIERIDDYHTWLARFEQKLEALPRDKKQASSLNVIGSLRRPSPTGEHMPGSQNFIEGVKTIAVGPEVPHLDEAFIRKCLADIHSLGLIAAPREVEAA